CMGFYPVCPGSNEYVLGSPCLKRAEINLENGMRFVIEAENLTDENIYIQSVILNGKPHRASFIRHEDIKNGGRLIFLMGPEPNRRCFDPENMPYSMSPSKSPAFINLAWSKKFFIASNKCP
ncbi:MAG: glycoside hydrolase family 92 protein, partial [Candidatus Aminicenantes bacterium]|nr:glycoside hydrolase family 92 protein [Candidatus Aminicenantes bacterium]